MLWFFNVHMFGGDGAAHIGCSSHRSRLRLGILMETLIDVFLNVHFSVLFGVELLLENRGVSLGSVFKAFADGSEWSGCHNRRRPISRHLARITTCRAAVIRVHTHFPLSAFWRLDEGNKAMGD